MKSFFKDYLANLVIVLIALGFIIGTVGVLATAIVLTVIFKNPLWLLLLLSEIFIVPLIVTFFKR